MATEPMTANTSDGGHWHVMGLAWRGFHAPLVMVMVQACACGDPNCDSMAWTVVGEGEKTWYRNRGAVQEFRPGVNQ